MSVSPAEVRDASRAFCQAVDGLTGPTNWTDDHRNPRTIEEAAQEASAALDDVKVWHEYETKGNQIVITVLELGGAE